MSGSTRSGAAGFEIDLGGTQITQVEGDGVEMLSVEDHVDMLDMFSLRMGGTGGQPKWTGFKEGQDVTVKVGKKTLSTEQTQLKTTSGRPSPRSPATRSRASPASTSARWTRCTSSGVVVRPASSRT